ncbi:hypothetical protein TSUD_278390 [Trifolium subterraneum]|uniref:Uncharacterized protein n=1 Tax=Trifolium subterraneum TaxID=3900 RepID=A0A2Z6M1N8_TRISU|nr:hypothetical protein TSUD_278390 [Trifolium subterraneum]
MKLVCSSMDYHETLVVVSYPAGAPNLDEFHDAKMLKLIACNENFQIARMQMMNTCDG